MEKIYTKDSNNESDWGLIETNQFKVNKKSNQRAWIIDNFSIIFYF